MQQKVKMKNKPIKTFFKDPPQTLVLQKKTTQIFPNKQKVALYFCDALKKYFSLLYSETEMQLSETNYSIINTLKNIQEIETITFYDGSSLNINNECCSKIIELYEELEEGHEEFEDYIMESDKNFLNILNYSITHKRI